MRVSLPNTEKQMNTQLIPPPNSLLSKMPSGREMYTIEPYQPPSLDKAVLEGMRGQPEGHDDYGDQPSSDDDRSSATYVGAYPGATDDYSRSVSTSGTTYY